MSLRCVQDDSATMPCLVDATGRLQPGHMLRNCHLRPRPALAGIDARVSLQARSTRSWGPFQPEPTVRCSRRPPRTGERPAHTASSGQLVRPGLTRPTGFASRTAINGRADGQGSYLHRRPTDPMRPPRARCALCGMLPTCSLLSLPPADE